MFCPSNASEECDDMSQDPAHSCSLLGPGVSIRTPLTTQFVSRLLTTSTKVHCQDNKQLENKSLPDIQPQQAPIQTLKETSDMVFPFIRSEKEL